MNGGSQRLRRYSDQWLPYLATLLVAVYVGLSGHARDTELHNQQQALAASNMERRSDTCIAFEAAHRQELINLSKTYRFVKELSPEQRREPLNRIIISGIPQMEANAYNPHDLLGAYVPAYCDEPNVGLPEKDPPFPTRPKDLKIP